MRIKARFAGNGRSLDKKRNAESRRHGVTLTEVIDRYLRALQGSLAQPSQEVAEITGLVPADIDGIKEYDDYLVARHSEIP